MDRTVEVAVNGHYLRSDNRTGGVQGEVNATTLRLVFDGGWDGYSKSVTFWDAHGENPVVRLLTADLLEDAGESLRIYRCPIPGESLTEAGWMTFVVEGSREGVVQRSASERLLVKESPIALEAGTPSTPTPTQVEQIQHQMTALLDDIHAVMAQQDTITEQAQQAVSSAARADAVAKEVATGVAKADERAEQAMAAALSAQSSATDAATSAQTTKDSEKTAILYGNSAWEAYTKANTVQYVLERMQTDMTAQAEQVAKQSADVSTRATDAEQYMTRAEQAAVRAEQQATEAKSSVQSAQTCVTAAEQATAEARTAWSGATDALAQTTAQTTAAQNSAERAEQSAERAERAMVSTPYIGENGHWFQWNPKTEQYEDSQVPARGPTGSQGATGATGEQGVNGVVLSVTAGQYGFSVSETGHLLLTYQDDTTPPNLSLGEDGHLYLTL